MSADGLSIDDWLEDDEDITTTDDPNFEPGSGDPKPEDEAEPGDNDDPEPKPEDGKNDDENDKPDPEGDGDDIPDDLDGEGLEGRKKPSNPEDDKKTGDDGDDPDGGDKPEDGDGPDVLQLLLEKYGVIGGVLDTSEGEKKFDELSDEDKLKALTQIIEHNRPKDDSSGLTEEQQKLVDGLRESKLNVDEYLDKVAEERQLNSEVSRMFDAPEYKFEDMDKDIIYAAYLRANDSEITDEKLEEELGLAKKSAMYDSTVEVLRKSFIDNREEQKNNYIQEQTEKRKSTNEETAKKFVDVAKTTEDISGWSLSEDEKNTVLKDMVEMDEAGKLAFQKELVENPENAFKAMWYLKYGEQKFEMIDSYYKEQLKKVYQRGLDDGSSGKKQGKRKNAVKDKKQEPIPKSPENSENDDSLEDWLNN